MDTLFGFLTSSNLVGIFIKLFGIVLSLLYFAYTFIVYRQVGILEKAIEVNDNGLLPIAAFIQLILSLILIVYSLFIL
jgi:hypothetical protein